MSSGKVILGLIAGSAIGAMAGILIAPDKGSSTRRKIVEHTNDLRTMLNDWATDFIDSVKNADDYYADEEPEFAPEMKLNTMG